VITYKPWASAGTLASGISAASTLTGSCFTNSSASSQSGAYRCSVDNLLYDPCFADAASGAGEVACPKVANPDSVIVIKLTSALPAPLAASSPVVPWLLVLANGQRCSPITGTGGPPLAGKPQDYGCDGASVYGMPDENSPTWTASYAPDGAAASAMTEVTVTQAYE
jgi:hypothetical protein